MQRASTEQAARLRAGLGDRSLEAIAVDDLRGIIVATGALGEVESIIVSRTQEALAALDAAPLATDARLALEGLATAATARSV